MFRSSAIIRELTLNLAKIIFILKHSVKLGRYLLCGCVTACCQQLCFDLLNFLPSLRRRSFLKRLHVSATSPDHHQVTSLKLRKLYNV